MDDIRKLVGLFVVLLVLVIGVLGGAWWAFESAGLSRVFIRSNSSYHTLKNCSSVYITEPRSNEETSDPISPTPPPVKPKVERDRDKPTKFAGRPSESGWGLHLDCLANERNWLPNVPGKRPITVHLELHRNKRVFFRSDRIGLAFDPDESAQIAGGALEQVRVLRETVAEDLKGNRTTSLVLDTETPVAEKIYLQWMLNGEIVVNSAADKKGLRPLRVLAVCGSAARGRTESKVPNKCAMAVESHESHDAQTFHPGDWATLRVVNNDRQPTTGIVRVLGVRSTRSAAGGTAKVYIVELPSSETGLVIALARDGWSYRLEELPKAAKQR